MDRIKIGILGYGGFGQFLHRSWNELSEVEIAAVADSRPEVNPGGIRFYEDWRELGRDDQIDVIAIVSPPFTHLELASALMEMGKHILVEKPIALTYEDAKQLIKIRDRTGRKAAVNHMLRFHPLVKILEEWAAEGLFGPLKHASVENYAQDEDLPSDHWFWNHDISGGILVEHAVHFIDLVGLLTDRAVQRVTGAAQQRPDGRQDRVLATVTYDNGPVATHFHQFSGLKCFETTSIQLAFDFLRIRTEGWIPLEGKIHALVDYERLRRLETLPGWQELDRQLLTDDGRTTQTKVTGCEISATHQVEGRFIMPDSKDRVYADLVRASLLDLVLAVKDSNHQQRVPLEAGACAVHIAEQAVKNL